ncbi:MAG: oligosaccharide flippase family protein [Caldilineaceae bacterium]
MSYDDDLSIPNDMDKSKTILPEETATLPSYSNHLVSLISNSFIALVVRQLGVNGVLFIGNIVLSRWVEPDTYGIFAVVLAFQTTLIIFADFGLGPALIQREQQPSKENIAGLFTVQLIIFASIALIIYSLAPWIAIVTMLGTDGQLIIRACTIILGITALRSIPALLLERQLHFGPIVLAEVLGTIIYQIVLLTLVWLNYHVLSIVYALIARYTCDLLIIWFFKPWRPRLSLQLRPILSYLSFGISMQGVRLMAYSKDQLPIILLVPFAGAYNAGIWGWAMTYIAIPIYLIRLVERVMFPAFARLQNNREQLSNLVTIALWLNFAMGVPLLLSLVVFAPNLIELIYGATWLTALPVIYLLTLNIAGGFMTPILFNFLYAIGEPALAFRMFAIWAGLTCFFSVPAILIWQLPGMAGAFSLATFVICLILFKVISTKIDVNLKHVLSGPALGLFIALIVKYLLLFISLDWRFSLLIVLLSYTTVFYAKDRHIISALIQKRLINYDTI